MDNLIDLMDNSEVVKFKKDDKFKAGKIPVDSAQCDNHLGFGNFTREVFDMDPNVCKCYALVKYLFQLGLTGPDRIAFVFFRHSGSQLLACGLLSRARPRRV